jgi:hypothetical protein
VELPKFSLHFDFEPGFFSFCFWLTSQSGTEKGHWFEYFDKWWTRSRLVLETSSIENMCWRRSICQIAVEFASSKTLVRNALIEYRIPLRGRWRTPHRLHNLPFGKKLKQGRVVNHEREQKVIVSILQMHRDGVSNRAIAKVLTNMRVPTKQRGKKCHFERVRQIIIRAKSRPS